MLRSQDFPLWQYCLCIFKPIWLRTKEIWLNSRLQLIIWASSQIYFSIGSQINGVYTWTTDWCISENQTTSHRFKVKKKNFLRDFLQSFLLQTGLNGHHRLLYPVETRYASSSKHEEKKKKRKKRRGYLKTWFGYGHDLMLNKPSCTGRRRQWHCSRPNTPLQQESLHLINQNWTWSKK